MSAGIILTELHGIELGIDGQGNLCLNTKGKTAENVQLGNTPGLVGKGIPTSVVVTNAIGASSNICNVTLQVSDVLGNAVSGVFDMDILLSDAATGVGLTATTASGGIAAVSGSGSIIGTFTASKAARIQTNASGVFTLAITDTAKTGFYPVAQFANYSAFVGAQRTTASYHS